MIKSIPGGSFDFQDPIAVIVPMHRHGVDAGWQVKRAAANVFDFDSLIPKAGEALVHLLAVGDGESYGCNRNGDYFSKAANEKYHTTFLKAGYFHHHQNKSDSPRYGRVVAAAHNPDMRRIELIIGVDMEKAAKDLEDLERDGDFPVSMSCMVLNDVCVPPNTPILTEYGELPISTVQEGDRVMTHKGIWRTVTATMKRKFSGERVDLILSGSYRQLQATHNHPVLIIREDMVRRCGGSVSNKKRRHTYNGTDSCVVCCETVPETSWVEAGDVRAGDYVVFPRTPELTDTPLTEDECWLLGMYLGDGCVTGKYGGRKRDLGWKAGGISYSCHSEDHQGVVARLERLGAKKYAAGSERKAWALVLRDRRLARIFVLFCGSGSHDKFIPPQAFHWPATKRLALLSGMLDSDGSIDGKKGSARFVTGNEGLTAGFSQLCLSLGLPASSQQHKNIGGYAGTSPTSWVAFLPASAVHQLVHSEKVRALEKVERREQTKLLVTPQFVGFPVKAIRREIVEYADVCNIAVEGDESYVARGCVVHNCSICGNKAKNRSEYCKHAQHHLTKICEDGRQVYVDNPEPNFFDISKVFRPADRIAWTFRRLAKAASDSFIGGAELAETLGIRPPADLAAFRLSRSWQEKQATVRRLASIPSAQGVRIRPFVQTGPEAALLENLRKEASMEKVFTALQDRCILLPVSAFADLLGMPKLSDDQETGVLAGVRALLDDPEETETLCKNGSYDGVPGSLSTTGTQTVQQLEEACGLRPDRATRRCVAQVAQSGLVKSASTQTVIPPGELRPVAREYAAYLVAFAHRAGNADTRPFVQNLVCAYVRE